MRARFTLFISNEDMNDIIKIIKSLKDSGVLIYEVTKTVKHQIGKQESEFRGGLIAPLDTSIEQHSHFNISSIVKGIEMEEELEKEG